MTNNDCSNNDCSNNDCSNNDCSNNDCSNNDCSNNDCSNNDCSNNDCSRNDCSNNDCSNNDCSDCSSNMWIAFLSDVKKSDLEPSSEKLNTDDEELKKDCTDKSSIKNDDLFNINMIIKSKDESKDESKDDKEFPKNHSTDTTINNTLITKLDDLSKDKQLGPPTGDLLKILDLIDNSFKPDSSRSSILNRRNSVNYNFGTSDDSSRPLLLFDRPALPRSIPPPLPPRPVSPPKEKVNIDVEITGLEDLLKMMDDYPLVSNIEYNIDMAKIHRIKEPLRELQNMVGMKTLKNSIVDQIIYFAQDLHALNKINQVDFMHTVIYGPPGTGKTEIAKIIGKIFAKLGVLKYGTFRKATRSELIAGYLGQTALKTRDVIKESLGGVLFIDEAYALGNNEQRDSFAKECIDTLCEALSDYKDQIMVIIAGYEKELDECFFEYNQGLQSRFTWRFKTDEYTSEELKNIFIKKVNDAGWSLADYSIETGWFESRMGYFKYYGRDMETLFAKTKIAHSRRVFCKSKDEKTKINKRDLDKGFKMYISNGEVEKRKNDCSDDYMAMYL